MATKSEFCKVENCGKPKDRKRGSAYCMMHRSRRSRFNSIDLPKKKQLPYGISKICKKHGELKEDDVYRVPNKNWVQCKICRSQSMIKFEEVHPGRDFNKQRNFIFIGGKRKLRVDKTVYEQLYEAQKGLCAICHQPETMISANKKSIKRLALDHCHETHLLRELLCHHCNVSLGGFKSSIEILESAIKYLKKHK